MNIKITKKVATFNKSKFGNNKVLVVVEFPNCISTTTNKSFEWMPTYYQLREIRKQLNEVENNWNQKKDESKSR